MVDPEAANCLRIDHATVEVFDRLGRAGVRPLLLKGPVITEWLHGGDRARRPYGDVDVLVAPDEADVARRVLASEGFAATGPAQRWGAARPDHAECWFRDEDRVAVDLHLTVHGGEWIGPDRVWAAATEGTDELALLGATVEGPAEPFRLVHLVLNLQPRDRPGTRAWTDLELAVRTVPPEGWRAAVDLARRHGLDGDLGPLLGRVSGGAPLAQALGLSTRWPLRLRLRHDAGTSVAKRLADLLEAPWRLKVGIARDLVVPRPSQLRRRHPDLGPSRRGLLRGYLRRIARAGQALRPPGAAKGGPRAAQRLDDAPQEGGEEEEHVL